MVNPLRPHHRLRVSNHAYAAFLLLSSSLTLPIWLLSSIQVLASQPDDGPTSTGTGIAVSRQGHILTNHHVVDNCASIRVITEGSQKEGTVLATDRKNDLAIVKFPQTLPHIARFRDGRSIRAGDSVVVVGFPLQGLLASEANVTTGTVSALAGLGNDTRFFQITAPVQPGNSGGPLLDKSGHVVGIVESKLNALAMALLTGDIPQNINFAIKDVVAKTFLDSHNIRYEKAVSTKDVEAADIGEAAKQFTFLLGCYPQRLGSKQHATIAAERRALETERRALERERQVLAEERQRERDAKAHRAEPETTEDIARELQEELDRIRLEAGTEEDNGGQTPIGTDYKQVDTTLKVPEMAPGSNAYLGLVRQRISSFWSAPPVDVTSQTYVVIVQFRIHRNGSVTGVSIERSSGNEYYDLAGKRAVLNAVPLPVFPPDITDSHFDAHYSFTVGEPPARNGAFSVKGTLPSEVGIPPHGFSSGTLSTAFNLAYNDYLNGKYELSAAGFRRFVKDFPRTTLIPKALYWLGESYYNLKDYGRAIETFDSLVAEYPGNEKVPAALYKLGLATAETGDLPKSRKNLKRVLAEFPSSDESKLAKNKLAELR